MYGVFFQARALCPSYFSGFGSLTWKLPVASLKHSCKSSSVPQTAVSKAHFSLQISCLFCSDCFPLAAESTPGTSRKPLGCLQPGKHKGRGAAVTHKLSGVREFCLTDLGDRCRNKNPLSWHHPISGYTDLLRQNTKLDI